MPELAGVPPAFELSARVSVRNAGGGDIVRVRWAHRTGSDTWAVASPLGHELARIESGPAGARLQRADAPAEMAASFGELTLRLLGAALEPAELVAWLHGQASPANAAGWQVVVEESRRAGAVDLARRITATRGPVMVKLVIDRYRVLED